MKETILAIDIFSVVIMVIIAYFIIFRAKIKEKQNTIIAFASLSIIVELATSIISNFSSGKTTPINTVSNGFGTLVMYLFSMITAFVISYLVFLKVSEKQKVSNRYLIASSIIAFVGIIFVFLNEFNNSIYNFVGNIMYRGKFSTIFFFYLTLYYVLMALLVFINRKPFKQNDIILDLIALTVPAFCMMISVIVFELPILGVFETITVFLVLHTIIIRNMIKEQEEKALMLGELKVIGSAFSGIFYYEWDNEKFRPSVLTDEYSRILDNGCLSEEIFLRDFVSNEDKDLIKELLSKDNINKIVRGKDAITEVEYREIFSGKVVWRVVNCFFVKETMQKPPQLFVAFKDITNQKNLITESKRLKNKFISTAKNMYVNILECDFETDKSFYIDFKGSEMQENPFHLSWKDGLRWYADEIIHPEDKENFMLKLGRDNLKNLNPGDSISFTFRAKPTGRYRWYKTIARIIENPGAKKSVLYLTQDINDDVIERGRLIDLGEHDELTDLYNRAKYREMIGSEYIVLDSCGVIFFDINNMKQTNDSYGHNAGDEIICRLADSIRAITSKSVHGYRIGGDEFVVIICNREKRMVDELLSRWSDRFDQLNAENDIKCEVAVGTAWADGMFTVTDLVKIADDNMYENKKQAGKPRE